MKKKAFLVALALFLTMGLVACGNDDNGDDAYESDTEEVAEDEEVEEEVVEDEDIDEEVDVEEEDTAADGPGHATSAGGITDEARLVEVLSADSPERAWVAGLAADIEMDGPLYMEGEAERHSAGEWSGVPARKIGFYQRDEVNGVERTPVGAFSLTVANGIHVNSPQAFFISDGPFLGEVFADVYVNVPYFRLSGVRINGDIIFANEEYRDTAVFQMWDSEIATINEGDDADYETDIVLYQSSTGFGELSSADATANVSNTDPANLVTGEIRVAE